MIDQVKTKSSGRANSGGFWSQDTMSAVAATGQFHLSYGSKQG
jgi:hypothetical protein